MANENCLEGWRCPECGNEDSFDVIATSVFRMTDDGGEPGDIEFDQNSPAYCTQCDFNGEVVHFQIPGYWEDEPNDDMDGDHQSALASAGFGTDEDYGG